MVIGLHPVRVLVLFGGRSPEHEISCLSARNIVAALDRDRYRVTTVGITRDGRWTLVDDVPQASDGLPSVPDDGDTVGLVNGVKGPRLVRFRDDDEVDVLGPVDVCFPVLHGPYGEDGTVQGLLASMRVPYVGACVAASAIGIDKRQMKNVFTARGLPQVPYVVVRRWRVEQDRSGVLDEIEDQLPYPMFTKPARQGSSIGIRKVRHRHDLAAGIDEALDYDRCVLVEQGLEDLRELECGVLGNAEIEVTFPGEVLTGNEFYDFEGKYLDDDLQLRCPADVPDDVRDRCMELARSAYLAIGARGMARVDLFYAGGEVLLNEINTIPGFTAASMFPYVWERQGLGTPQLVERLLELAFEAADSEARFSP
ncbi:MAG TPA: D-alanine--D-alanine ligase family protein [Euzebyales bacterium]|nr:D-alanine--D-alanine ligase family protein [Euzebyales bacterium]